jgi:ubiquinone/menaquinone biosynthesis C-methylase UbiE
VPEGWEWDGSLFGGSAAYYDQGRLPYPLGLREQFAALADLSGEPRLIDVGCGPGKVALILAGLFSEVVGVDPDVGMIREAKRLASGRGVTNATWAQVRAEELPARLGRFRYATFAQSFHWMERELVARLIFEMLEPGGAFVHVGGREVDTPPPERPLPHPPPPAEEIVRLRERYLGAARRAGQGVLLHGTPANEWAVLEAAGFEAPQVAVVQGRQVLERCIDDVVANVFSASGTAPHLFGDRLEDFEGELRKALLAASPSGLFSERIGDLALVFYRRP